MRAKKPCRVCKATRGNKSGRDWKAHLAKCLEKVTAPAGVQSIRKFVSPPPPTTATASPSPSTSTGDGTSRERTQNTCDGAGAGASTSGAEDNPGVFSVSLKSQGVEQESFCPANDLDSESSEDDAVYEIPVEVLLSSEDGMATADKDDRSSLTSMSALSPCSTFVSDADASIVGDNSSVASPPSPSPSLLSPTPTPTDYEQGGERRISDIADLISDDSDHAMEVETEAGPAFDPSDPSSFSSIQSFSQTMVDVIVGKGPNQPNASDLKHKKFPERSLAGRTRSFQPAWYYQKLSDGSQQKRDWLSYSETTDKIYCVHCILFGKTGDKAKHPAFVKDGFQAWHRATETIIRHETSVAHVEAAVKAGLRKITLPINATLEQQRQTVKAQNREVVHQLIDITLYLAQHCLAFRGHRQGAQEKIRGNFLDLVSLLGKYSPAMAAYLQKLQSSKIKKPRNFLSWRRQNQYIHALAEFIKKTVKQELQSAHFISVSLDETLDTSRKEQCSCIMRYVCSKTGTVVERLVGLKATASTTGESLFQVLKSIFEELGVDWTEYLVGQSYDGASNMRGAYHGVQELVRQKAECAVYVWCWAHRLNLAVRDSVAKCLEAAVLFKNMKELYNLINGSKNNVALYEDFYRKHYPGKQMRRLQRIDTTRWMAHSFALTTVLEAFEALVDTLDDIRKNGSGDSKATANGLYKYLLSEKFVLSALCFDSIFDEIGPLSAALQGEDIDLMCAISHVEKVLAKLKSMRSDEGFDSLRDKTNSFIEKRSELFTFKLLPITRTKRTTKRYGEKADDEPIEDRFLKVKVELYFFSLDLISSLISDRFNDRAKGLYKDLALFTSHRISEMRQNPLSLPEDAFKAFCAIYEKFVKADDLRREYLQFIECFPAYEKALELPSRLHAEADWLDVHVVEEIGDEDKDDIHDNDDSEADDVPQETHHETSALPPASADVSTHSSSMGRILKVTHCTGLKKIFPALYIALRIAVTLPVSSASTERSFSKLKIIKNRLRSTMAQERLEDLMIIACENDIEIDSTEVIEIISLVSNYMRDQLF
ncbi:Zinc finger MYM-type protein 1 [Frankliniella fusca]|uniref:Zinc finger MYM-type protein 1 n=1 Tax=Frankliniella fusca TaxID=407009 RepID=A0AAE1I3Y7_9NEOP|nr:Zinc finger MYM-type protein 1 [Frankliniella fusca]